ncbi:MAG: hypothetical protein ACI4L9_05225 [Candidatus Coproplasma sp.]
MLKLATAGSFDYTRISSEYHLSGLSGKSTPEGYKSGTAEFNNTTEGYYVDPYSSTKVWIKVPNDTTGLIFKAYCDESDGWTNRYIRDFNVSIRIIDKDAPVIQNWYVDSSVKHSGEKLRVFIRFSEPVSFNSSRYAAEGSAPYLTAQLNSNINYPVTLTYASGNYTDTLCFELDVDDIPYDGNFTSLKITSMGNANNVRDFALLSNGQYGNTFSQDVNTSTVNLSQRLNISVDNRTPVITATNSSAEKVLCAHTVSVKFEKLESGTLYYAWTDDDTTPVEYYEVVEGVTDSAKEPVRIVGENMNGEKWLHLKVVSSFGTEKTLSAGPYKFDNMSPQISVGDGLGSGGESSNRFVKYISIEANDLPDGCNAGITSLKMYVADSPNDSSPIVRTLYDSTATPVETFDNTVVLRADDLGIETGVRKKVWVYLVAQDALGNEVTTEYYTYIFDTNDYFDSVFTPSQNSDIKYFTTSDGEYAVTILSSGTMARTVSFEVINIDEYYYEYEPGVISLYRFEYNDEAEGYMLFNDTVYTQTPYVTSDGKKGVTIKLDDPKAGYYELSLKITDNASLTKFSQTYAFYLSYGEDSELTNNYLSLSNASVLTNRVYQLSETYPYFYYMDATSSVKRVSYNGGSLLPATFSSYSKAYDFVYANELRDLYAITLSKDQASMLENNSSDTLKASGETTTASEGQVWIRYKSSTWTPNSSSSAWVYYYYNSTGETIINADGLPKLLRDALSAVSNKICSLGGQTFLTGEGKLDAYGAPYLNQAQMHVQPQSFVATMCGNSFRNAVVYGGDELYDSQITVGGNVYKLATNASFTFGRYTRLYYKLYGADDSAYTEITAPVISASGSKLRVIDFFLGRQSGIYTVREADDNGIREYNIYVDLSAPEITVSSTIMVKDANGNRIPQTETITLHDSADAEGRTFSAAGMSFTGLSDADHYSYMAIYRYSGTFVRVLTIEEVMEGFELDEGDYRILVSDRSGNSYAFIVRINSSDMVCSVKQIENEYIRVTCNRSDEQIARYEIYCDNILVSSTYSASAVYKDSGNYRIYIRDWYGNVYDEEFSFERVLPEIVWKFERDGGWYTYDENTTTEMKMVKTGTANFFITTSKTLSFSFTEDLGFSFIGKAPEYVGPTSGASGTKTVRFKTDAPFTIKIYYNKFPDVYAVYTCAVDVEPPTISVEFDSRQYALDEDAEIQDRGLQASVGDIIVPSSITYSLANIEKAYVNSGDTVRADLLKATFTDASDVKSVVVYLNGELFTESDGSGTMLFSRNGEYTIVATDVFGNSTSFKFTKTQSDYVRYFVDGVEQTIDYDCLEYFSNIGGVKTYTKKEYGNDSVSVRLYEESVLYCTVTAEDGSTRYAALFFNQGKLYYLYYKVDEVEGVNRVNEMKGEVAFSFEDGSAKAGVWYAITQASSGMPALYARFDTDGSVSVKYATDGSGEQVVEMRIMSKDGNSVPVYIKCGLCSDNPTIGFVDEEGAAFTAKSDGELTGINGSFAVGTIPEKVVKVGVYYSQVNSFDGAKDIYAASKYFTDDGFYLIKVSDIYGNSSTYLIMLANSFIVTGSVKYSDGQIFAYSSDYDGTLYSDGEAYLDAYSALSDVVVTKDGQAYTGYTLENGDGYVRVILAEEGKFTVNFTDAYGNSAQKTVEINSAGLIFNNSLLYGFNEDALRRDEGYTNSKISISAEVVASDGIKYIAIVSGGNAKVLYDALSQNGKEFDRDELYQCVGADGDGEYRIVVRNLYGSAASYTVHYSQTSTLVLERVTRSSGEREFCEVDSAVTYGLWSNNTLEFSTQATEYRFTVDGKSEECPYTLGFATSAEEGSFDYEITYVDEYGFKYTFSAHLLRRKITINITEGINTVMIDGTPTANCNIAVTIDGNSTCVYSIDGGQSVSYVSGDKLARDGVYRFTVTDYAGNVAAYTVKKDTVAEFEFTESGSGNTVLNGGVVCSDKVIFSAKNGDTSYLRSVFRNGVAVEDNKEVKFSDSGLWEFIVADAVGNTAYFSFRIISHALSAFNYVTPHDYKITDVWFDSGNGIKLSYMQFVEGEGTTFNFTEDGSYSVVMSSAITGDVRNFSFVINSSAPDVKLSGCEEGETTLNDVTVTGYKVGDTIEVYRDGKLVKTVHILTAATDAPVISEGGVYRIVVSNEAGVSTELNFTRKHIPNVAGNVLIIIVTCAMAVGLFVGLIYRNRSKTDE